MTEEGKPKENLGIPADLEHFSKMDSKQKYSLYKSQFEGLTDLGTFANLNEYTARKLKQ